MEFELLREDKDGNFTRVGEQLGDDLGAAGERCLELLRETGHRHGLGVSERTRRTKAAAGETAKPAAKTSDASS